MSVPATYAYTYIKIIFLKQLIMDSGTLQKLKDITEIDEFIRFIEPFYPGLKIKDFSIEEIEKRLYYIYIKLIGKIILFSPINIRRFLKDYLLKYEIMNIKQIILGSIIGMSLEEKTKNVNFTVEEYLENTDFIKKLIELSSIDEIQLYMKRSRYYQVIREGILYFKNYNEIFVLESFLDKLYYTNMIKREKIYNPKEKAIISLYNSFMTEIYNINLIYRSKINKIDKDLISQFMVDKYLFLDNKKISILLDQENLNDFFLKLDDFLKKASDLRYSFNISNAKNPISQLERLYFNYYFKKFKIEADCIDSSTIFRILELIIKKEKEIKLEIIPNIVGIIQRKFKSLKTMI